MNWGKVRFIPLFMLLGLVTLVQFFVARSVAADAPGETDFRRAMSDDSGENFSNACGNFGETNDALSGTEGTDSLTGTGSEDDSSGNDPGTDCSCGECGGSL